MSGWGVQLKIYFSPRKSFKIKNSTVGRVSVLLCVERVFCGIEWKSAGVGCLFSINEVK